MFYEYAALLNFNFPEDFSVMRAKFEPFNIANSSDLQAPRRRTISFGAKVAPVGSGGRSLIIPV